MQPEIEMAGDMYFPTRQLEQYLHLPHNSMVVLPDTNPFPTHYPASQFINRKNDATLDMTTDYSRAYSSSFWRGFYISESLREMEEPVLYNMDLPENTEVYRFAFLPSFDPSVVIRVTMQKGKAKLYWVKRSYIVNKKDEKGSFVMERGHKIFTKKQYSDFLSLLKETDFDNIPNILEYDIPMTDGTWWVGEHRTSMQYNAKFSEIVGPNNQIFRFLLKVSNIHTTWGERTL